MIIERMKQFMGLIIIVRYNAQNIGSYNIGEVVEVLQV